MIRHRFTPAAFPDAPAPGQYTRIDGRLVIACGECGTVQPIERPEMRHPCASPSCPEMYWVELVRATPPVRPQPA